jgi:AcrR family transcriptional regulator
MKRSDGCRADGSSSEAGSGPAAAPAGGARAAILAATVQLLRERGLTATRTRDVTALAGLSTGLLNHYFTWNALRAAALEQVMAQGLATLWPSDAESDPRQLMEALAESAFSDTLDPLWRLWVEAVEAASTDPAIADVLMHANNAFVARIGECLKRGAERGVWRCPDPDGAAFRLMALHDGLVGMVLTGLPGLTRASAIAHWRTAFGLECPTAR